MGSENNITILAVEYDSLPYVRLLPKTYKKYTIDLFSKHGVYLPAYENLREDKDYLYGFTDKMLIKLRLSDGTTYYITILPGFLMDLASVPWFLKSFVDDNDPHIIVAAIFHDGSYKTQLFSFDDSNDMFRQIIRIEGGSWFFAWAAHKGVDNGIAKKVYNNKTPKILEQNKQFFKVSLLPK